MARRASHRNDDHVVEMTDDRDEIRDEVEGQRQVAEREAEQNLGPSRTPRVREDALVHPQLPDEIAADVAESQGLHGVRLAPDGGWWPRLESNQRHAV